MSTREKPHGTPPTLEELEEMDHAHLARAYLVLLRSRREARKAHEESRHININLAAQLQASQERVRELMEALRHISDFNWKECERCSDSIDGDWEVDHSREIAEQALERAGRE